MTFQYVPQGINGLLPYNCQREDARDSDIVLATNFRLHHLKKYNMTMNCPSTYYIYSGCLRSSYLFASNLSGTPKEDIGPVDGRLPDFGAVDGSLPHWPSDFNDSKRFDPVKESELQANDWIRLYLELALCANDRWISDSQLSQLQILKVVTTWVHISTQDVGTYFYTTFKGLAMARIGEIGEYVERKVIVRRVVNEHTGYLTLLGGFGVSIGEQTVQRPMSQPNLELAFAELPQKRPETLPARRIALNLFDWGEKTIDAPRQDKIH